MARSLPPDAPTRELGGYPVRESTLTDIPAAPPPPPPPPPGRARWPWLAALALLVLLGGLGAAYAVAHRDSHRSAQSAPRTVQPSPAPAPVTSAPKATVAKAPKPKPKPKPNLRVVVPRVVGETVGQAKSTLRALGLAATTSTVRSRQPRNTVIGQNPGSGDKLRRGRAVRIEISAGPPHKPAAPAATAPAPVQPPPATPTPPPPPPPPALVSVPDVRGQTLAAARAAIRGAGLVTETHTVPSHEAKGTVVAESPTAGRRVKRGSHVLVNVSQGAPTPSTKPPPPPAPPAPQETTAVSKASVPNVVGQEEATALAALQQAGFNVDEVDSPTSDQSQDGTVVSEQPSAGSQIANGATVTISIGRYTATG